MDRDYKELKDCEVCTKPFSFGRVRHKCKRCKLIICDDCGKTKSIIIGYKKAPAVPHRVCNACREDINTQNEVKDKYATSWATLSGLATDWLISCQILNVLDLNSQNNYARYLEDSHNESHVKVLVTYLLQDLSQGRADRESFNYSLTEFFYYSQQGKDKDSVRKNVENVLRAFYARYPELGYSTLLINVATFLLCFADEEAAFYFLCYLKEKILPARFWDSFSRPIPYIGLYKERYILQKTAHNLIFDSSTPNLSHFDSMFNKVANTLIGGLVVDVVDFKTQLYVWNEMFSQNSIRPLELSIVKILKYSKNYSEGFRNMTLNNYRIFVCRSIHEDTLRNDHLDISDEVKRRDSEEFDRYAIDKIVSRKERLVEALQLFKSVSANDAKQIIARIVKLSQNDKGKKKEKVNFPELSQADFLNILKDAESLQQIEEKELVNVFQALDSQGKNTVSSSVLAGLVILFGQDDLNTKLNNVFSLFDNDHELTKKEIPQLLSFLAEVLPVFNEANLGYLNFQVHLYEVLEKLKKKVKKADKITLQDFHRIGSKYPLFHAILDERRHFLSSNSILSYVSMTTDNESSSSSDEQAPMNEQEFESILDEQVVEKIVDKEYEHKRSRRSSKKSSSSSSKSRSSSKKSRRSSSVIDQPIFVSSNAHYASSATTESHSVPKEKEHVPLGSRFGIQLMRPPSFLEEQVKEEEKPVEVVVESNQQYHFYNPNEPYNNTHNGYHDPHHNHHNHQHDRQVHHAVHNEHTYTYYEPNAVSVGVVNEAVVIKTDTTYIVVGEKVESVRYSSIESSETHEAANRIVYLSTPEGKLVEVSPNKHDTNESYLVKGTNDNTQSDIEPNEFYNEVKIQYQISASEKKVVNRDTSSAIEKDDSCQLCNIF